MRKVALALLIGLMPVLAYGADRPDWAFPVTDKVQPPSQDDGLPKTAPGSDKSYTRKQIDDLFNPPDWYPGHASADAAGGRAWQWHYGSRLRSLPFADRHRPR